MRLRVGSGLPNIQKKDLNLLNVRFPNHYEQTKIADFLAALDNKISHLQNQKVKTEQYKKGLLQQMFC